MAEILVAHADTIRLTSNLARSLPTHRQVDALRRRLTPPSVDGPSVQADSSGTAHMGAVRHERIVSDPGVMGGKPVIRGTRVPVELLLAKLGRGLSVDELLAAYPHLAREDVLAALSFAADYLRLEDIEFAAPAAA